ncbi:MAG: prepilin-type N-terminal cleavage/methylation domain-containing protein [Limisphaerales bacterium]
MKFSRTSRPLRRPPSNAFTLIELLVVIAIIAILAALLLPAFAASKAQARSTVCKNHLHEMGVAVRMYVDDTGAYPYYANPEAATMDQYNSWFDIIQPYYHLNWTNREFHCPTYQGDLSTFQGSGPCYGSYAYNLWGCTWFGYSQINQNNPGLSFISLGVMANRGYPLRRDQDVSAPSETYAIMDTLAAIQNPPSLPSAFTVFGSGLSGYDANGCVYLKIDATGGMWNALTTFPIPIPHGKSLNVLSCDSHVAAVLFTNLFDPYKTAANWNVDHKSHPELWESIWGER